MVPACGSTVLLASLRPRPPSPSSSAPAPNHISLQDHCADGRGTRGILPILMHARASQRKPPVLSCLLSQREGGREGRAEAGGEGGGERQRGRESGREERSFTNRDRRRQKHLRELPLPTAAQEFSEHRSCDADHQNPGFEVGNYTSTRTFRADEADGTKVLEVRAPL